MIPTGDFSPAVSYFTQDPSTVEWGFPGKFIEMISMGGAMVDRIFEWGAGPLMTGTLAIPLIRAGQARTACVGVGHESQIGNLTEVLESLKLTDVVDVRVSADLGTFPESESWDVAVTVPPHFNDGDTTSVFHDPEWVGHRAFFASCKKHLKENGKIIILENIMACTPTTHFTLASEYGFQVTYESSEYAGREGFYFIVYGR